MLLKAAAQAALTSIVFQLSGFHAFCLLYGAAVCSDHGYGPLQSTRSQMPYITVSSPILAGIGRRQDDRMIAVCEFAQSAKLFSGVMRYFFIIGVHWVFALTIPFF